MLSHLSWHRGLAYTALLGAGSFFSAANKNLLTGANSALSVDSLSDAIRLLREQLDETGDPVSFSPATLLVSPALESTAKTILASQEIRRDDGSGVYGVGNPHEKALELVVEHNLNLEKIDGSSPTQWYVGADPSKNAGTVSALGEGAPMIKSIDPTAANPNVLLAAVWQGVMDVSVSMQEHRAIVKSTGA